MKILILSCNTGEGHNSAAHAICEAFKSQGNECEIADTLRFSGKRRTALVTSSFNSIIKRAPKVFGVAYKVSGIYSSTKLTSPIYFANTLYAKNLFRYIRSKGFDVIICTHLFAMEAMTYIGRKYPLAARCYGVLTDYTCVPFMEETDLDGYFIPHEDLIEECVQKGMIRSRLFPSGIPVNPKFNMPVSKQEARERLNISQDKRMYLIMTGGLGYGKVSDLCEALLMGSGDETYINVLVGKNRSLKDSIDEKHRFDNRVKTIDFTENVNIYMTAADVLLSKPGGISSTEAAVVKVPLVHTLAIPGCETKNGKFFAQRGMSINAETLEEAVYHSRILAYDSNRAESMRKKQGENINSNAAYDIVKYIKERYYNPAKIG